MSTTLKSDSERDASVVTQIAHERDLSVHCVHHQHRHVVRTLRNLCHVSLPRLSSLQLGDVSCNVMGLYAVSRNDRHLWNSLPAICPLRTDDPDERDQNDVAAS